MANKKEISVVFSFAFVYPVIILMISWEISWVNGLSKHVLVLWLSDIEINSDVVLGCETMKI